jgi:hypothetical protein
VGKVSDLIAFSPPIDKRNNLSKYNFGQGTAQMVCHQLLTTENDVHIQDSQHEICSGQSGTGTGFSQVLQFFPCQYHSII